MRKRWKWLILCLAVLMLCRIGWIYWPSQGELTFHIQETGETIREPLTREEIITVKKIVSGHIRWSELLYGYPACGFGDIFSITIDGVCYMPAWDSCGTVAVEGRLGVCKYMDISEEEKEILVDMITSIGK